MLPAPHEPRALISPPNLRASHRTNFDLVLILHSPRRKARTCSTARCMHCGLDLAPKLVRAFEDSIPRFARGAWEKRS